MTYEERKKKCNGESSDEENRESKKQRSLICVWDLSRLKGGFCFFFSKFLQVHSGVHRWDNELWKGFIFTNMENEMVKVDAECQLLIEEHIELCVVGKVLLSKCINSDAFRTVMKTVSKLRLIRQVTISLSYVLTKFGLWSQVRGLLDKGLVILISLIAAAQPSELVFTYVSFWVQINYVPFKCITKVMTIKLGSTLWQVKTVDCEGFTNWVREWLR